MHGPYKGLQAPKLETNRDLSAPWPFSSRSDHSAMGCCFITSPATLLKTCCSKGTFWSVLKSWNLCLLMQRDKLKKKKKHEKSHCSLRSAVIQLPLSQGTGKVQSEVLQSSHTGVCIFWGRERLSQRSQKLESMTFYSYCFNSFTHMPSRDVLYFKIAVSAKNCMVWSSVVRHSFFKNIFLDLYYSLSLLYRCEKQKVSHACKTLLSSKFIQIKFKRVICWSQWNNNCIELS